MDLVPHNNLKNVGTIIIPILQLRKLKHIETNDLSKQVAEASDAGNLVWSWLFNTELYILKNTKRLFSKAMVEPFFFSGLSNLIFLIL